MKRNLFKLERYGSSFFYNSMPRVWGALDYRLYQFYEGTGWVQIDGRL